MRVLAVYNFDGCQLGLVEIALKEINAEIDLVRAYLGEVIPDSPDNYDAILVFGGTQNALSDDVSPWQPHLVKLLKDFAESGRSVLGICLGSQLLARAYGGTNIIGGATEFGWKEITLTKEGCDDPLFVGVDRCFPIFQWHDDTYTLPQDAIHLARNGEVINQAFRIGRAAYGVQFHFEADRNLVSKWSEETKDFLLEHKPGWIEHRHRIDSERFGEQADRAGLTIARNWVATIKPHSTNNSND